MSKKGKNRSLYTLMLLLVLAAVAYYFYQRFFGASVKFADKNYAYVYISRGDDLQDISGHLEDEGIIKDENSFQWLAEKMDLPENIHPGRFRITNGMNLRQIINLLKYNKQEYVKMTFNSQIRTIEDFVAYSDEKLELGESELEDFVTDEKRLYDNFKLDPDNCFAMLVPGVFEVSWAISMDEYIDVLKTRYKKLWSPDRVRQAERLGYNIVEIATIASIVQCESGIESEQEKIAGVYVNRLKKNMPLQADPTLKFANKNFEVNRVLDVDKDVNSPYNTYKYKGLPPGPICLVGPQAIDATLNYSRHSFFYFCAKPQLNGFSDFSTSYEQHRKYATAYQKALDKVGISR